MPQSAATTIVSSKDAESQGVKRRIPAHFFRPLPLFLGYHNMQYRRIAPCLYPGTQCRNMIVKERHQPSRSMVLHRVTQQYATLPSECVFMMADSLSRFRGLVRLVGSLPRILSDYRWACNAIGEQGLMMPWHHGRPELLLI